MAMSVYLIHYFVVNVSTLQIVDVLQSVHVDGNPRNDVEAGNPEG